MHQYQEVILYTISCPKCKVLKKKLDAAGIDYSIVDNENILKELGFNKLPVLTVQSNGILKIMEFTAAIDWVNEKEGTQF